MVVRLSPELEAIVEREVAEGRYTSIEDYFVDAIESMQERREWGGQTLSEFNATLDESIAQAERGELMDEAEVRRQMQASKQQWRARQTA